MVSTNTAQGQNDIDSIAVIMDSNHVQGQLGEKENVKIDQEEEATDVLCDHSRGGYGTEKTTQNATSEGGGESGKINKKLTDDTNSNIDIAGGEKDGSNKGTGDVYEAPKQCEKQTKDLDHDSNEGYEEGVHDAVSVVGEESGDSVIMKDRKKDEQNAVIDGYNNPGNDGEEGLFSEQRNDPKDMYVGSSTVGKIPNSTGGIGAEVQEQGDPTKDKHQTNTYSNVTVQEVDGTPHPIVQEGQESPPLIVQDVEGSSPPIVQEGDESTLPIVQEEDGSRPPIVHEELESLPKNKNNVNIKMFKENESIV